MGQKKSIEFFDKEWQKVDSKNDAAFYREIMYDKNDKPIGITHDYYMSGKLQWEGRLISVNPDVKDGKCTWYYENGNISKTEVYINGNADGPVTEYYENGVLAFEGGWYPYLGNHGICTWYYSNGKKYCEGMYEQGQKTGVHQWWYDNGKKRARENYIEGGHSVGISFYWDYQGKQHLFFPHPSKAGNIIETLNAIYYEGVPDSLMLTKEGDELLDTTQLAYSKNYYGLDREYSIGDNTIYYINGTPRYKFYLNDKGEMEGLYTEWNENGIKDNEANYHNNTYDGKYTYWNEKGGKRYEKHYSNGILHGSIKEWQWGDSTRLLISGQFCNGQRCGVWQTVDKLEDWPLKFSVDSILPDGSQKFRDYYIDSLTLKPLTLMSKGRVRIEDNEQRIIPLDSVTLYYKTGEKMGDVIFENGKVKKSYHYYKNGQLIVGYKKVNNTINDDIIFYYPSGKIFSEGKIKKNNYIVDNVYNHSGKFLVKNGTGEIIRPGHNGSKTKYEFKNGIISTQLHYRSNGNLMEETHFDEMQFKVIHETPSFYILGLSMLEQDSLLQYFWFEHVKSANKIAQLFFYENGSKQQEVNYKNDIPNGWCRRWYPNGKLQFERKDVNGKMEGLYREWYENGNKKTEGYYNGDKMDGVWKSWDEQGKLINESEYKNNKKIR